MKRLKLLLISLLFVIAGCSEQAPVKNSPDTKVKGQMEVTVMDVGQANCFLFQSEDFTMLIDAGNRNDEEKILSELEQAGVERFDVVIATHMHEDHMGSMAAVLNAYDVDYFYVGNETSKTRVVQNLEDVLAKKKIEAIVPEPEEVIEFPGGYVEFFGPLAKYGDINNSSVSGMIHYGKTKMFFGGDIEFAVEEDLMNTYGKELDCDIYYVNHHGSASTSNTLEWIQTLSPKTAIISSNKKEVPEYNHPHVETLQRLDEVEADIYRTDEMQDIRIILDGENYKVVPKVEQESKELDRLNEQVIGNKNSKMYHKQNCKSLPKEKNRIYFTEEEAIKEGYTRCGVCY